MAKKDKAAGAGFIKCVSYDLRALNDEETSFDFSIKVTGADAGVYKLKNSPAEDANPVVQALLAVIAANWPGMDFEFRVDDLKQIIEVR